jgi:DNA-binding MarR family transcriptional regulator
MEVAVLQVIASDISAFESEHGQLTIQRLQDFYAFKAATNTQTPQPKPQPFVWKVSEYIVYLYRYARYYCKHALEGFQLQSMDEFAYVADVFGRREEAQHNPILEEGISKAELTDRHIHERTTGMEIITRLLKRGFFEQRASKRDKREKLLYLTPMGQAAFFEAAPVMENVAKHIVGQLSQQDIDRLLQNLGHLEDFHNPYFTQRRVQELVQQWRANAENPASLWEDGNPPKSE